MKRQILLTLVATCLALPSLARDFTYTYEGQTLTYTVIDEAAKTVKTKEGASAGPGNNVSGDLEIPSVVICDGVEYSVTSIGYSAFYGCQDLISVIIPNSVTSIGEWAFAYCYGLTSLTIPNSVTSIGEYAFFICTGLTDITIPNSVTSIGEWAFAECGGLTSLTIPNSVTNIEEYAFSGCYGLTSLTIPNSVTSIGERAFSNCWRLTSLTIPNSVTSIGERAFHACEGLTDITIPNSVTSIGEYAFSFCTSLTMVDIPNSVTFIGTAPFYYCTSLKSINVDSANLWYTSINGVLFNFDHTTLIQYPTGRTATRYSIPQSVTSISKEAFADCKNLTSITIPSSVTYIGECAFNGCEGLTSVTIPSSVTYIGDNAFLYCLRLKEIDVYPNNDHYASIDGVLFNKDLTTLIKYQSSVPFQNYTIPNTVTCISDYAFHQQGGIASVTIPNSVTYIGDNAFLYCSSLTSITLPDSITFIGNYALGGCTNLTSITSYAMNPPTCNGSIVYNYSYSNITLYVPNEAVDTYKASEVWCQFDNIVGFAVISDPFTTEINGLHYILTPADHTAVVTYAEQNSLGNYGGMQSVIVPETVEYEGERYTVTGIGDEAFNNCWGLKAVSLPSTLQSIGKLAFGYCTSLRSVTIPDDVTVIDDEAFTGCSALASVQIGSSVETIGDYAFFGCTGLASLHVPESVKTIGENAFMGIHWINEVHAKAETPADAPISAFSTNAYRNATLVVPDGAVDTYKAHPTWSNFLEIRQNSDIPTNIQVVDGAIVVKGAESVRIYNTSGAEVYSGPAGRIELPSGIYLVATDSISKKVKI